MFSKTTKLEARLKEAQARKDKARSALSSHHKGEEYEVARQELLKVERELAAQKGEPYAIPLQFSVQWSVGASLPHLLVNEDKAFLIFYVNQPDPDWDGTDVRLVDPGDDSPVSLALVEFEQCRSAKLGAPNNEVLAGHYLYGKGLEAYSVQIVKNSPWLEEVKATNKVHPLFRADSWSDLTHYIFWFHDTTFECIATTYQVELHTKSLQQLLNDVCSKLIKGE